MTAFTKINNGSGAFRKGSGVGSFTKTKRTSSSSSTKQQTDMSQTGNGSMSSSNSMVDSARETLSSLK